MKRLVLALACALVLAFLVTPAMAEPWAWVYYPGKWTQPPGQYYARLTFDIDSDVTAAYLFLTGDDSADVHLNGKPVGGSGDWYTLKPVTLQTMQPLFKKGKNVLAAHVPNNEYEGGFICKGMILLASGRRIELNSGKSWRCIEKLPENWAQIDCDDSAWKPSEVIGTPPAGPWGVPTTPPSRMAAGSVRIGDAESEKAFQYACTGGEAMTTTLEYPDGVKVTIAGRKGAAAEKFTVKLPTTDYVILRRKMAPGGAGDLQVKVDGKDAGTWHSATPTAGKAADGFFVLPGELVTRPEIEITLAPVKAGDYTSYGYDIVLSYEWYMLGEGATRSVDREVLAKKCEAEPKNAVAAFLLGLALEGEHNWAAAEAAYRRTAELIGMGDIADSALRGARLAGAMQAKASAGTDARKLYTIALFLKANAFYSEAADVFRASIAAKPSAEAYDQLGEAILFAGQPKEALKAWEAGLKEFPPKDTNRWTAMAELRPTKDQLAMVEPQKEQMHEMEQFIYCSSRGRMELPVKMLPSDAPPKEKLFGWGELDSFFTIAGGAGGGSTYGPDVTYANSGFSAFGFVTVFGVAWHEWIHQLECGLASSGNGWGWGGCHSSTPFGYRPPWWQWYRAAMRYYITPGGYERVCLSDHWKAPYVDQWLVTGPFASKDEYPSWICFPGKRTAANYAWNTRKTFSLSELPQKATLAATGDDYVIVYVNGNRAGAFGSWMSAPTINITRFLVKGQNVIGLTGYNEAYDGGVIAYGLLEFPGAKRQDLVTDATWKTEDGDSKAFKNLYAYTQAAGEAWTKPGFDDSAWKASEVIGKYPCAPWGRIAIDLPDTLMTIQFAGATAGSPSAADGWRPVALKEKMAKLDEIAPPPAGAYQTVTYAFTYAYVPKDMRVQMAVGSSRHAVVTINGEKQFQAGGGGFPTLPCVQPVCLKKGWNRVLFQVEELGKGSLFWAKIFAPDGKAIEGLKYSNEKPSEGVVADQQTLPKFDPARPKFYRWTDVSEDPYTLMPRLTAADLAAYTGYKKLKISGGNNFLFIDLGGQKTPEGYKALAAYTGGEQEVNNALTWDFEPLAVVRYAAGDKSHDLVFVKPDGVVTVFESKLIKGAPGSTPPAEKILGWVLENGRLCIVAETDLGTLPARTMDLLSVN